MLAKAKIDSFAPLRLCEQKNLTKKPRNILCSQIAALYLQSNDCIMIQRRDVFQAIADPTRRAILTLVAFNTMTAGTIADEFDSTRQTISKHIQVLTECELLVQEQKGREIYYHFNAKKMKEVADFIKPFQKMWEGRFSKLDKILINLKKEKK